MNNEEINEEFPDEQLFQILHFLEVSNVPLYADYVNFFASRVTTELPLSIKEKVLRRCQALFLERPSVVQKGVGPNHSMMWTRGENGEDY